MQTTNESETVHISPTSNRRADVYHTDPDCRYVRENSREVDQAALPDDWRECSACQGDPPSPTKGPQDLNNALKRAGGILDE